jgi:hypothetical protein
MQKPKEADVLRHGAWRRRPKCRAKLSGAAQPDAGPARSIWQLCCATTKGAAATYTAPCSMTLQKKVSPVKYFRLEGLFFKFV